MCDFIGAYWLVGLGAYLLCGVAMLAVLVVMNGPMHEKPTTVILAALLVILLWPVSFVLAIMD